MTTLLFSNSKATSKKLENIDEPLKRLNDKREYLHNLKTSDLVTFFDACAQKISTDKKLAATLGANLRPLADFMKKENVEETLTVSLRGNYEVLDEFQSLTKNPNVIYRAQPRGLAVHWLAGNVSILGVYSIIQCLLTKNVSLVKASSREYEALLKLLEYFAAIETPALKGSELLSAIKVILVDRDDIATQEAMSMNADIRIAWGGHDAVNAILSLKKRFFTEDLVYGPKYSYGVIDKHSLINNGKELAQRLAFDISTFDQYACSSPHTVFIEENSEFPPVKFAKLLAENMEKVNRMFIPKQSEGPAKAMDILGARTEHELTGKVFASENTDWTVIYTENEGLGEACFSRVVFIKPLKNLSDVKKFNDRRKQTLGLAINPKEKHKFMNDVTLYGVDRCPPFGTMTLFESPWDGMFGLDRMVRWVRSTND